MVVSFYYNLNFISLAVEGYSAAELMPKMCVSYCSMTEKPFSRLLKISEIWAFEIISGNRIILILHFTCLREVWAGHSAAVVVCSWAGCYFSLPRCRKGGCSCPWSVIKSLDDRVLMSTPWVLMEALWDYQRHMQKECRLLTSVLCHAGNSANLLDFKHFQLIVC